MHAPRLPVHGWLASESGGGPQPRPGVCRGHARRASAVPGGPLLDAGPRQASIKRAGQPGGELRRPEAVDPTTARSPVSTTSCSTCAALGRPRVFRKVPGGSAGTSAHHGRKGGAGGRADAVRGKRCLGPGQPVDPEGPPSDGGPAAASPSAEFAVCQPRRRGREGGLGHRGRMASRGKGRMSPRRRALQPPHLPHQDCRWRSAAAERHEEPSKRRRPQPTRAGARCGRAGPAQRAPGAGGEGSGAGSRWLAGPDAFTDAGVGLGVLGQAAAPDQMSFRDCAPVACGPLETSFGSTKVTVTEVGPVGTQAAPWARERGKGVLARSPGEARHHGMVPGACRCLARRTGGTGVGAARAARARGSPGPKDMARGRGRLRSALSGPGRP